MSETAEIDLERGVELPQALNRRFLVHNTQSILPLRDFYHEVRAIRDVDSLFLSIVVQLDVRLTRLDEILKRMVNQIELPADESISYTEVCNALLGFTDCGNMKVPCIRQRVQSIGVGEEDAAPDQCWLALHCQLDTILRRQICIARLSSPVNFGPELGDIQFVLLVLGSNYEKDLKSSLETARTIGTLFSDPAVRNGILMARSPAEVRDHLRKAAHAQRDQLMNEVEKHSLLSEASDKGSWYPGRGILDDFRRRLQHYKSDYIDGIDSARSIQKTISASVFLFFSIIPTVIALGMLNDRNTHGKIDVKRAMLSQCIGGLVFGVFGGQLFLIMLSTAPISIYIEIIEHISDSQSYDFFKVYTTVGLWCSMFLIVAAFTELSIIMKYARRSLEELFGLFISVALVIKAISACVKSLTDFRADCSAKDYVALECERSAGLLFILLMTGTLWISLTLFRFRSSPFLSKTKRELLSDYALPLAVLIMAVVGVWIFEDIPKETFTFDEQKPVLTAQNFWNQSIVAHATCFGLGIPLAILFFVDQLIVTNTVDNTQNNLKKGSAANWDLFVVGLMNALLSVLGLPWMHGALPQAFLHLRALADIEDRLVDGTVQAIVVKTRETRLATVIAHLLMVPTYFFLLPHLQLIPTSVFHGLFLYLAFTSTVGNEFCVRLLLLCTEQRSYAPTHFLRRVPQRIVHLFTGIELAQLALLCFVGFAPWPVLELIFPVIVLLFLPFRAWVLPRLISHKDLEALDGVH